MNLTGPNNPKRLWDFSMGKFAEVDKAVLAELKVFPAGRRSVISFRNLRKSECNLFG
jgi:hypothetical protein